MSRNRQSSDSAVLSGKVSRKNLPPDDTFSPDDRWITVKEMEDICLPCARKMMQKGLTKIKVIRKF